MRAPLLLSTLLLFIFMVPAYAGQLDDLEREATKPSSTSKKNSSSNTSSNNSKSNSNFNDKLEDKVAKEAASTLIKAAPDIIIFSAKVIGYSAATVIAGGYASNERYIRSEPETFDDNELNSEQPENKNKYSASKEFFRVQGDPLVPMIRASSQWLFSSSDINAQLNRIEAGYSFLGMSYSQNILNEDGDQLILANALVHYRMSFHNDLSWDFAYGRGKMNGNQKHNGSVFAMPIRLRFNSNWHFEYYPVWSSYKGGSLSEHQFSFNYHYKYIGATVGYKTWSAGTASVDGLFSGLYISF